MKNQNNTAQSAGKKSFLQKKNVEISFAKEAKTGVPIMSNGVEPCSKKGIYVHNVEKLVLDHVQVTGADGAPVEAVDVDEMIQK